MSVDSNRNVKDAECQTELGPPYCIHLYMKPIVGDPKGRWPKWYAQYTRRARNALSLINDLEKKYGNSREFARYRVGIAATQKLRHHAYVIRHMMKVLEPCMKTSADLFKLYILDVWKQMEIPLKMLCKLRKKAGFKNTYDFERRVASVKTEIKLIASTQKELIHAEKISSRVEEIAHIEKNISQTQTKTATAQVSSQSEVAECQADLPPPYNGLLLERDSLAYDFITKKTYYSERASHTHFRIGCCLDEIPGYSDRFAQLREILAHTQKFSRYANGIKYVTKTETHSNWYHWKTVFEKLVPDIWKEVEIALKMICDLRNKKSLENYLFGGAEASIQTEFVQDQEVNQKENNLSMMADDNEDISYNSSHDDSDDDSDWFLPCNKDYVYVRGGSKRAKALGNADAVGMKSTAREIEDNDEDDWEDLFPYELFSSPSPSPSPSSGVATTFQNDPPGPSTDTRDPSGLFPSSTFDGRSIDFAKRDEEHELPPRKTRNDGEDGESESSRKRNKAKDLSSSISGSNSSTSQLSARPTPAALTHRIPPANEEARARDVSQSTSTQPAAVLSGPSNGNNLQDDSPSSSDEPSIFSHHFVPCDHTYFRLAETTDMRPQQHGCLPVETKEVLNDGSNSSTFQLSDLTTSTPSAAAPHIVTVPGGTNPILKDQSTEFDGLESDNQEVALLLQKLATLQAELDAKTKATTTASTQTEVVLAQEVSLQTEGVVKQDFETQTDTVEQDKREHSLDSTHFDSSFLSQPTTNNSAAAAKKNVVAAGTKALKRPSLAEAVLNAPTSTLEMKREAQQEKAEGIKSINSGTEDKREHSPDSTDIDSSSLAEATAARKKVVAAATKPLKHPSIAEEVLNEHVAAYKDKPEDENEHVEVSGNGQIKTKVEIAEFFLKLDKERIDFEVGPSSIEEELREVSDPDIVEHFRLKMAFSEATTDFQSSEDKVDSIVDSLVKATTDLEKKIFAPMLKAAVDYRNDCGIKRMEAREKVLEKEQQLKDKKFKLLEKEAKKRYNKKNLRDAGKMRIREYQEEKEKEKKFSSLTFTIVKQTHDFAIFRADNERIVRMQEAGLPEDYRLIFPRKFPLPDVSSLLSPPSNEDLTKPSCSQTDERKIKKAKRTQWPKVDQHKH